MSSTFYKHYWWDVHIMYYLNGNVNIWFIETDFVRVISIAKCHYESTRVAMVQALFFHHMNMQRDHPKILTRDDHMTIVAACITIKVMSTLRKQFHLPIQNVVFCNSPFFTFNSFNVKWFTCSCTTWMFKKLYNSKLV